MSVPDPFELRHQAERGSAFRRTADGFVATPWAGGPWDTASCHGGAVAGLLVRAVAHVPTLAPMGLARLTIDIFAPLPVGAAIVARVRVGKDGKRLQRIGVDLVADGRCVASGTLLRVRLAGVGKVEPARLPFRATNAVRGSPGGFANSFDIIAEEGGIAALGPGRVWFRLAEPLVEGEAIDLVANAVAIADFSSAIGMSRDYRDFVFPSVDLTVGMARAPVDDWILVDSSNHDWSEGRATCHATLSDALGPFAKVIQTSFVDRRSARLGEEAGAA